MQLYIYCIKHVVLKYVCTVQWLNQANKPHTILHRLIFYYDILGLFTNLQEDTTTIATGMVSTVSLTPLRITLETGHADEGSSR